MDETNPLLLLPAPADEEGADVLAWRFCRSRMRVSIESLRTSFVTCTSNT